MESSGCWMPCVARKFSNSSHTNCGALSDLRLNGYPYPVGPIVLFVHMAFKTCCKCIAKAYGQSPTQPLDRKHTA